MSRRTTPRPEALLPLVVTGEPEVDDLLNTNPLALLIGMLLDQQISIELAFRGPARLATRLDGNLEAATIAALDPEQLAELFATRPALHRFPASMARRTHALCVMLVDEHDGDPTSVWSSATTGAEVVCALKRLPGFGPEKSRIFAALLAKRFGVCPPGWEEAVGAFADEVPRSVADVTDPSVLDEIRAYRAELKAAGRGKDG